MILTRLQGSATESGSLRIAVDFGNLQKFERVNKMVRA